MLRSLLASTACLVEVGCYRFHSYGNFFAISVEVQSLAHGKIVFLVNVTMIVVLMTGLGKEWNQKVP